MCPPTGSLACSHARTVVAGGSRNLPARQVLHAGAGNGGKGGREKHQRSRHSTASLCTNIPIRQQAIQFQQAVQPGRLGPRQPARLRGWRKQPPTQAQGKSPGRTGAVSGSSLCEGKEEPRGAAGVIGCTRRLHIAAAACAQPKHGGPCSPGFTPLAGRLGARKSPVPVCQARSTAYHINQQYIK